MLTIQYCHRKYYLIAHEYELRLCQQPSLGILS